MARRLFGVTALISCVALAAPVSRYSVRVLVEAGGKKTFVPVGTVERQPDGGVVAKGLPAPALDGLSTQFAARWKAFKRPAQVTVTQHLADGSGMRPSYQDHSVTFVPGDRLFTHAVVRQFLGQFGYGELGLSTIDFIAFDSSAEGPPGAHDRGSTYSNFRKGTGDESLFDANGEDVVFVYAKVRKPRSPLRVRPSASDPSVGLAASNDDGHFEVGTLRIFQDGRVEVTTSTAASAFSSRFGTVPETASFSVVTKTGEWRKVEVPKGSPLVLEAYLLDTLETYGQYDVSPVIDPALVK